MLELVFDGVGKYYTAWKRIEDLLKCSSEELSSKRDRLKMIILEQYTNYCSREEFSLPTLLRWLVNELRVDGLPIRFDGKDGYASRLLAEEATLRRKSNADAILERIQAFLISEKSGALKSLDDVLMHLSQQYEVNIPSTGTKVDKTDQIEICEIEIQKNPRLGDKYRLFCSRNQRLQLTNGE